MLSQFEHYIATHFPDFKSQNVGVAISGGVDSVVLAHLLYKVVPRYELSLVSHHKGWVGGFRTSERHKKKNFD